jgi:mannosylglucosylglycerate synthase
MPPLSGPHPATAARSEPCHRYGDAIPTAALLSFRLGGSDGVSVEAAKWQWALNALGFSVLTVAGEGPVDRVLPGLAIDAPEPPGRRQLAAALDDADLVVVENLCSLPLNPRAAVVAAAVLAVRPAVLHHHDLPWQRPHLADHPPPPDDPRWSHVTINELSRGQLAERGIAAATIYNAFSVGDPMGDDPGTGDSTQGGRRARLRGSLGLGDDQRLVLQPTRAIPRKNVAGGMAVAAELGAVYWLLGPAEDGYGPELDALVGAAACPVILGPTADGVGRAVDDAYLACDAVVLPSTWEGFGNPTVESAIHRRPLSIGPYPVAAELAAFGFEWFPLSDTGRLGEWLDAPDPGLLEANLAVASAHFSLSRLPDKIAAILPER